MFRGNSNRKVRKSYGSGSDLISQCYAVVGNMSKLNPVIKLSVPFILVCLGMVLWWTFAIAQSFSDLEKWVGHYPWDGPGKKEQDFFKLPEIERTLAKLLSKKDLKKLTQTYVVGVPIELVEGYLLVEKCKPHNCPGKNAVLAVEVKSSSLFVVLYDASSGADDNESTRCFSTNGDLVDLPSGVKESILQMHIPNMTRDDLLLPKNLWLDKVKCKRPQ